MTGDTPGQGRAPPVQGQDAPDSIERGVGLGQTSVIDESTQAAREAAQVAMGKQHFHRIALPADGEFEVMDASKLGRSQGVEVLDRVVPRGDDAAHLSMLHRVMRRLERVGMSVPTIRVRYRDLTVIGKARVGKTTVPSMDAVVVDALRSLRGHKATRPLVILDRATGVLKPGTFTLLLGPPGSGRSTFMRAVVGQQGWGLKVKGDLTFNGESLDRFVPQRAAAYIQQHDNHFGELTVRETVDFAARCQSSGYERQQLADLLEREKEMGILPDPELDAFMKASALTAKDNLIVELVLRLIGLDHVAETLVGNQMLRGISGGQKKRVGLAEALVGRARVLMADEISTGLDSNTTYSITKTLRDATHVTQATTVVALLQPAPETARLFDELLVIASGAILFQGPADEALALFDSLGLTCPARQGPADFLQLVMIPSDQQRFWSRREEYAFVPTAAVRAAYEATPRFQAALEELEDDASWRVTTPPPRAGAAARLRARSPAAVVQAREADPNWSSLPRHDFGADWKQLLRANLRRAMLFEIRNYMFVVIRIVQLVIMSFCVATLFISTPRHTLSNGNSIMGALFFSVLMQMLNGFSELQVMTGRLSVLYKQRDAKYYPTWTFVGGSTLFRLPFALLDASVWTFIMYWAIGLSGTVRFLVFWLFMFLANLWSVSMFAALGAMFQKDTAANGVGAFFLLVFMIASGFIINRLQIPAWWIGAYWADPVAYVLRSVVVNQFRSGQWDVPNVDDPTNPLPLGYQVMQFWGMFSAPKWVWIGLGAILVSWLINQLAIVVSLNVLPPLHGRTTLSEEALEELEYSRAPGAGPAPAAVLADVKAGAIRFARLKESKEAASRENLAELAERAENGELLVAGEGAGGADDVESGKGRGLEATASAASGSSAVSAEKAAAAAGNGHVASPSSSSPADAASALPFHPLSMSFRNIEYSVPVPPGMDTSSADVPTDGPHAGMLRLLYDVNGALVPGRLTALMGASGAGKTTLMDVLAGRKTGGTITGDVRVNGYPKRQSTFMRVAGYVEQTDVHVGQATVEEALEFSAALRLPLGVAAETRHAFVEEVMALVELNKIRNAHVGDPGESGLSIQQRKRLTIAVELVANPSIIFLDEPTTGLDARAASIVMSTVRSVVDTGRTVVCTIHQPSLDIFEEFTELLLLKPGGRCIYAGPIGLESSDLIAYFCQFEGVEPLPAGVNPADWMLEQTNPGNEKRLGMDFAEAFSVSEARAAQAKLVDALMEPPAGSSDLDPVALANPGFVEQFKLLLARDFQIYWRSPDYNTARAFVTLMLAFSVGSIGWRFGAHRSSAQNVLNVAGMLYLATLFLGWTNFSTIMPLIDAQRKVMYRERAAGAYTEFPFALAQGVVEVPYLIVQAIVYSCIVYWMVYFIADAAKFFWFLFFLGLTLALFTAYGLMCANIMPDPNLGILVGAFFFGFWNLFCGFLQPQPDIRGWWIWMYWLNPVTYVIYGLVTSQLGDLNDEYITSTSGQLVTIPELLRDSYGYKYSFMPANVGVIIAFTIVFWVSSGASLKVINHQKR